ncbi:hypothetical protein Tco_0892418 [Tanacetum coccineum]|uniref:Uncharacterized protein n=1 Tax=Tanacetum coccineum TaxID=301880 RepID=A0ABQ5C651_9ASTR
MQTVREDDIVDNDSDDGEVLNELIGYENVGMLRRERAINSFDRMTWHSNIQRISLTGFPAQSVGSSNTDVLDSPCLLVLITGTSQSRQHSKSESDSYYLSD